MGELILADCGGKIRKLFRNGEMVHFSIGNLHNTHLHDNYLLNASTTLALPLVFIY